MKKSNSERFWEKVNKNGPIHPIHGQCWEWIGGKTINGYGRFSINKILYSATRVSWFLNRGDIPADESYHGICVCHHCDNTSCVNPDHLFLGTMKNNMKDCVKKNRKFVQKNEASPNCKFSNVLIEQIRNERKTGVTERFLATKYNISRSHIHNILSRKWRK